MKYNLGAGQSPLDGYENWDIKTGQAAYPLDIPDGSADEIRASHLLEHFGQREVFNVISHWTEKLKSGGTLKIAVPDFEKIIKSYQDKSDNRMAAYLMGGQVDEYDYHKSIFDRESLSELMKKSGLDDITEWSDSGDCASLPVSLNLMGTRKNNQIVNRSISAVISMPRLCFTDTVNCMMQQLVARRIPVQTGSGVFWSQVLTRMMQKVIDEQSDYILTLDYDSWFTYEHVEQMLSVMERNPELDALCAMQMKRECESPLMGIVDADGKMVTEILRSDFEKDYMPILTGHFGLTLFRVKSLSRLKKPWFVGVPNKDGEWEEGRLDDDIYFWHNFKECGLKAGIAPGVPIGHLQLLCTFPGRPEDGLKPVHVPVSDLKDSEKIPEHCR